MLTIYFCLPARGFQPTIWLETRAFAALPSPVRDHISNFALIDLQFSREILVAPGKWGRYEMLVKRIVWNKPREGKVET